ncbi:MAG: HD domain-containing protein [Alkalispirochaetaceae bacterium]
MRIRELESAGIRYAWDSFTALDRYFRVPAAPFRYLVVEANLSEIAAHFDEMSFQGYLDSDALAHHEGQQLLIRCADTIRELPGRSYQVQHLLYESSRDCYLDLEEAYDLVRSGSVGQERSFPVTGYERLHRWLDLAILLSRYPLEQPRRLPEPIGERLGEDLSTLRPAFSLILTGPTPWRGLELLRIGGILEALLPEMARMNETDHSKEGHPEGNVWTHTLETLKYRKTYEEILSLALLFHDIGKPFSYAEGAQRFSRHADIGAEVAREILDRFGYPQDMVEAVDWLVRFHMIPGALHRLPTHRSRPLMQRELFPFLLELHRCDVSATFRGPESYYRACRVYRSFLRNERNPFRDAEGKKLVRLLVE